MIITTTAATEMPIATSSFTETRIIITKLVILFEIYIYVSWRIKDDVYLALLPQHWALYAKVDSTSTLYIYIYTHTEVYSFFTLADSQHTCVRVSNLLFMNCHSISQDITRFSYIIISTSCTCYYVYQVRRGAVYRVFYPKCFCFFHSVEVEPTYCKWHFLHEAK